MQQGHVLLVSKLLSKNCYIYTRITCSNSVINVSKNYYITGEYTALDYAAERGFDAIAELLLVHSLTHKPLNRYEEDKSLCELSAKPLLLACQSGNLKLVKLILAYGGKQELTKNKQSLYRSYEGNAWLNAACESGNVQLVEFIISTLSYESLDKNSLNIAGRKAALKGQSNVIQYLINEGAEICLNDAFHSKNKPTILLAIFATGNITAPIGCD